MVFFVGETLGDVKCSIKKKLEQLPGIGFPRETASHKRDKIIKVLQDCMTKRGPIFSTQATLKTLQSLPNKKPDPGGFLQVRRVDVRKHV